MTTSLFSSDFLSDIALTLIHFLWQGMLVATILKLVLVTISERKPHIKYLFASLAMVANIILPLLTYYLVSQPENNLAIVSSSITNEQRLQLPLFSQQPDFLSNLQVYLPYLTIIWLISIAFLSARLLIQMFQVHRLPATKIDHQFTKLNAHFLQLVNKLELKRIPKLVVSVSVHVPMAIGWLKPVVMLPASMVSGLTSEQLEMLFLHELAHIKRHDYLVNLLQSIVEILLFFHPAVHWVSKQMRIEREYCSDDIAVQHCGDAFAYAHTLADTASICRKHHHHAIPDMAMAATGGELKNRIVRLVNQHHCTSTLNKSKWLAAILISCALIILSTQYLSQAFYLMEDQVPSKQLAENLSKEPEAIPLLKQSTIQKPILNTAIVETVNEPFITNNETLRKTAKIKQLDDKENNIQLAASNSIKANEVNELPINKAQITANTFTPNTSIDKVTEKTKPTIEKNNKVEVKTENALHLNKLSKPILTTYKTPAVSSFNKEKAQLVSLAADTANTNTAKNVFLKQPKLTASQQLVNTTANENTKLSAVKNEVLSVKADNREENKKVFTDAQAISIIDPKYPSRAEFKGLELDLLVNFSIDENGSVTNIEIEKKHKSRYFRSEIIKALTKWKFLPAQENGQPVASNMSKIFSFNLETTS